MAGPLLPPDSDNPVEKWESEEERLYQHVGRGARCWLRLLLLVHGGRHADGQRRCHGRETASSPSALAGRLLFQLVVWWGGREASRASTASRTLEPVDGDDGGVAATAASRDATHTELPLLTVSVVCWADGWRESVTRPLIGSR